MQVGGARIVLVLVLYHPHSFFLDWFCLDCLLAINEEDLTNLERKEGRNHSKDYLFD